MPALYAGVSGLLCGLWAFYLCVLWLMAAAIVASVFPLPLAARHSSLLLSGACTYSNQVTVPQCRSIAGSASHAIKACARMCPQRRSKDQRIDMRYVTKPSTRPLRVEIRRGRHAR